MQPGEADSLKKSALIAMAMTLFVMTIVVNMIATGVVSIDGAGRISTLNSAAKSTRPNTT